MYISGYLQMGSWEVTLTQLNRQRSQVLPVCSCGGTVRHQSVASRSRAINRGRVIVAEEGRAARGEGLVELKVPPLPPRLACMYRQRLRHA